MHDLFFRAKARIEAQRAQFGDEVVTMKGEPIGPHGVMFAKSYEDQSLVMWHKHYPGKQVFVTRDFIHQDPKANMYEGWEGKPWGKYELNVCIAKIDYRYIVCRAWVMDMIRYEANKVRKELGLQPVFRMEHRDYEKPHRTVSTVRSGHTYVVTPDSPLPTGPVLIEGRPMDPNE